MTRRGDSGKLFNVSVVGLSGTERDKGQLGVGKSCLCNRFVRPKADDYYVEHISVLSQTDFSGRVINNDHFLYWGEVSRISEDGVEFHFQVVEQSEFVDDSSFQPFKGGKMDPYVKRCSNTKLQSAEKLMYICKNQLGIEKEYDQKVLPDGKFNVDGFLCVIDVSVVPSRPIEKQLDFIAAVLQNLLKTKKPVVIVTSKNDDACDAFVREVERLVNRKEFKGNIPIVETSSHDNVNIDLAFVILAQMVDKSKGRTRILPYAEASRARKETLDAATEAYMRLVRMQAQDYRAVWGLTSKKLAQHQDFVHFVDLVGLDDAKRMFVKHVKRLKDEHLARKVKGYMDNLPDILLDMYPDIPSLGDGDWERIKEEIHQHPDFEHYFLDCPAEVSWLDMDLLESTENRIPFEVLDLGEAEAVYRNHINMLQREQRLSVYRKEFKQLLEESGYVTPGKNLAEVQVLFMGRECFEALSEGECQKIYDQHQKEIIEKAKSNFQELLFEYADLFYQFSSVTVTAEDVREIKERLMEDSRYKALDRLDNERQKLLLHHLSFIQYPRRENCQSFPHCVDAVVENILKSKSSIDSSSLKKQQQNNWLNSQDLGQLNIVVLGNAGVAQELVREVKDLCDDDEYELNGQIHTFQFKIIEGDVTQPQNAIRFSGFIPNGCFCTYSSLESLDYIRGSLEKTLLSNLETSDGVSFQGLPIVLLLAADPSVPEADLERLRSEGMSLADSLQSTFFDVTEETTSDSVYGLRSSEFSHALRTLVTAIQHKSGLVSIYQTLSEISDPDIRVILTLLCGDPYSVENVLAPLLSHQSCVVTGDRTLMIETFLGDCRRKVEITVSSYHAATEYRESLIHGYILVYSTKRKASLAVLNAFSANIPDVPIQLLAVTETGGVNVLFSSELSHQLITLGNSIADRLQAHFMTLTPTCSQKPALYTPFFRHVWERKLEIEKAYHMDDSGQLHDSGEGTLERPPRPPLPPPRNDSRHMRSGSNDGSRSGSEIYERLPTDGSIGDGLDDGCSPTFHKANRRLIASDDSDVYSTLDRDGDRRTGERYNGELLIKPSLIKAKRGQPGWLDDSIFMRRPEDPWIHSSESYSQRAFTTGRRRYPPPSGPPPAVPGKESMAFNNKPGRINMKEFSNVTDVLARIRLSNARSEGREALIPPVPPPRLGKVGSSSSVPTPPPKLRGAPLATPESEETDVFSPKVKEGMGSHFGGSYDGDYSYNSSSVLQTGASSKPRSRLRRDKEQRQAFTDSDSDLSSPDRGLRSSDPLYRNSRKSGSGKRVRRKRAAIPVAMPKAPSLPLTPRADPRLQPLLPEGAAKGKLRDPTYGLLQDDESAEEVSSPKDKENNTLLSRLQSGHDRERERDRSVQRRRDKQKAKDDEKLERRKLKEEERQRKQSEKERKRKTKSGNAVKAPATLDEVVQSEGRSLPLFLEKCVNFIEQEGGLESEGIYRVPGNRVHVDLLFQKYEEDPANLDMRALDIPVNAAATALKEFFKRLPPVLSPDLMTELEDISLKSDRSCRLVALRGLLQKLSPIGFCVLKFIFQHFVRVAENSRINSMDSKNLAICWWPTLLPFEFSDMTRFECMRPHMEDTVQAIIDQYPFLFCGKDEVLMV